MLFRSGFGVDSEKRASGRTVGSSLSSILATLAGKRERGRSEIRRGGRAKWDERVGLYGCGEDVSGRCGRVENTEEYGICDSCGMWTGG